MKTSPNKNIILLSLLYNGILWDTGADPGFFLGGGGGVHSSLALLQHQ